MPELPEVQTVVDGLNSTIRGKTIAGIHEYRPGTVQYRNGAAARGTITAAARRGKYILILTSENSKLIIHLRMTGKLVFETDPDRSSSHCRAEITFSDASRLIFDDVRTFGRILVMNTADTLPSLDRLGPEPLAGGFNCAYLQQAVKHRKTPIKSLLLDQTFVAGLGNIYTIEILHACGIDPRQPAGSLSSDQLERIASVTAAVLTDAIAHNGTTISNYRRIDEKSGEFQKFLKVYQKNICRCGEPVSRIKIAGRSTYFCPACQHHSCQEPVKPEDS